MNDMTDELREHIRTLETRGAQVATQAAKDGIGTELLRVVEGARAHLGCSTIPDEKVEAAAEAAYRVDYGVNAGPIPDNDVAHYQSIARAVLEAAARVGTEKQ